MNNMSINELEFLFKLVIGKLKSGNVNQIEFDIDEYWLVSTGDWSDFNKEPELSVGSLSEDISYLRRAISESKIFTYSDFDRLASVLRYVSEKEASSKSGK
jgi:hypothetical protein